MSNPFVNRNESAPLPPRPALEAKYKSGRSNLLLVIAFTLINMVLLLAGGNVYFLFSASIPYFLTWFGMELCGKLPPEYYHGRQSPEFLDSSFLVLTVVIALVILGVYLLSWIFSSKGRVAWLILALVLFSLDTVILILLQGISVDGIMDILLHGVVLYYLISGVMAHFKLKNYPPEEEAPAVDPADPFAAPFEEKPFETADSQNDSSDDQ